MATLQFTGIADRLDAAARHAPRRTVRQRVARWMQHRRALAVLRQMEPRLLQDAGLKPPVAVQAAAFTVNHHIVWGAAGWPRGGHPRD